MFHRPDKLFFLKHKSDMVQLVDHINTARPLALSVLRGTRLFNVVLRELIYAVVIPRNPLFGDEFDS